MVIISNVTNISKHYSCKNVCVIMSTGKVSFKFDTTLFCKSNASPLLLLSSSWVLRGGDQRQSSNDPMGNGERLRHDYFICCWRKLYS